MRPSLAYLAGYIDGEGSIGWYSGPRLVVVNTYLGTLLDFQARWGGSVVPHRRSKNKNLRQQFRWSIYGSTALAVCKEIMPYLFEKRRQARLLLAIAEQPKGLFRTGLIQALKEAKKVESTHNNG